MGVHGVERTGASASGWIASESGAAFEVEISLSSGSGPASCRLYIDGVKITSKRLDSAKLRRTIRGFRSTPTTIHKLHFAQINISDADTGVARDSAVLSQLGTIRIEYWRCRMTQQVKPWNAVAMPKTLSDELVVNERDKKLGGHHVTLGVKEQCRASRSYKSEHLDAQPAAILEFRYRPKELLQAQGVLSAVEASPLSKKRLADHLDDQTNRVAKRPKKLPSVKVEPVARDAYVHKLKARVHQLEAEHPTRVKAEAATSGRRDDVVIDLTSD
ncbi:hypothetical protein EXIGLDRAFT_732556 [Exidia glandulosa HHB12029]|uniref:DUF7918 domain-containing protein n=1 Tax=Exidia glandulosa HHB12029 TaxID=1314781 RepID=A0A165BHE0_EXIGL|nr:hypothetical protein EXIGLDRAFT_732556 [Exidia glandulosa HHB12029]